MTERRLSRRQEKFILKYFETGNGGLACEMAGYSPRSARFRASEMLAKPQFQARLAEYRKRAEDASVATVLEKRQILAEIMRTRFCDFNDITELTTAELKSAGVQEFRITEWRHVKGGKGQKQKRTITFKLRDPIAAISEDNKMMGVYTDTNTVNIDNRQVHISVVSEKAKELTEGIQTGEGTD